MYRNFKDFKEHDFNQNLQKRLSVEFAEKHVPFENFFLEILNNHALLKEIVVGANNGPYLTKAFRKAIIQLLQ